jgi:hypothetical protein
MENNIQNPRENDGIFLMKQYRQNNPSASKNIARDINAMY